MPFAQLMMKSDLACGPPAAVLFLARVGQPLLPAPRPAPGLQTFWGPHHRVATYYTYTLTLHQVTWPVYFALPLAFDGVAAEPLQATASHCW